MCVVASWRVVSKNIIYVLRERVFYAHETSSHCYEMSISPHLIGINQNISGRQRPSIILFICILVTKKMLLKYRLIFVSL